MAAKTMLKTISDAITGNGTADAQSFTVASDPEVIEARKAEDEAVALAHKLEDGLAQLVSERAHHDAEYTKAAGLPDEAAVREGRRRFIASDEAVRGAQDRIKRAQLAATAARQRREQVEVEAEARVAAKIRERLAAITARVVKAVEGELIPAFTEAEQVADAAEIFAGWGSPTARRQGYCAGLGVNGRALFRARGQLSTTGPHTFSAAVLRDPTAADGGLWGQFTKTARDLGLLSE